MSTGYGMPWHHVGRRVLHNPMQALGEQYCLGCKEWQSGQQEGRYEGEVFATKVWCRKCGTVITYSVTGPRGTPDQLRRASQWARAREVITREPRSVTDAQIR